MKSLTSTYLPVICVLKLYFAGKLLRKATSSRLLEAQKVAPNSERCSKVAEHGRDRPICVSKFLILAPRIRCPHLASRSLLFEYHDA